MAKYYIVKRKDSLWRIAKIELSDPLLWKEIAKLNNLNSPYIIHVGQVLELPKLESWSDIYKKFRPDNYNKDEELKKRNKKKETSDAKNTLANISAKEVGLPTLEYTCEIPKFVKILPPYVITFELEVKLSIKKKGFLENFVFNKEGVTLGCVTHSAKGSRSVDVQKCLESAKKEDEKVLDSLLVKPSIIPEKLFADEPDFYIKSPLTANVKTYLYSTKVEMMPKITIITLSPNTLKGVHEGKWMFEGDLTGKITIAKKPGRIKHPYPIGDKVRYRRRVKKVRWVPGIEPINNPIAVQIPLYIALGIAIKSFLNAAATAVTGPIIIDGRILEAANPNRRDRLMIQ